MLLEHEDVVVALDALANTVRQENQQAAVQFTKNRSNLRTGWN